MISRFAGSHDRSPPATAANPPTCRTPSRSQPLTVLEIFQSQGCNSCPPTNNNLLDVLGREGIPEDNFLLLSYHVTYWDYLGWPDPFGQKACDQRQREYVNRMGLRSAFTPQVIVNGRASGVGNRKDELKKLIAQGQAGHHMPIEIKATTEEDKSIRIEVADPTNPFRNKLRVIMATYDPAEVGVSVPRGENSGSLLKHINVVKGLTTLGECSNGKGGNFVVNDSSPQQNWERAILVQEGVGGPIVGACLL